MFEHVRPEWLGIDPAELGDYLSSQGVTASWNELSDGLHIWADSDISAVLASFTPTSTLDGNLTTTYVAAIPTTAAVQTHLQHIKDFRNTIRSGGPAPTLAQTQHVLADVIDALRFIDARFLRDL